MQNLKLLLIGLWLPLLLVACVENPETTTESPVETPPTTAPAPPTAPASGKVHAAIPCLIDPASSFALYLPQNYSTEQKWPVLFCFDPHAKGSDPVKLYKDLAEEFGYILVGSNNSKNGMDYPQTDVFVSTLITDINARFSTDPARMFAAGFSGGARIATRAAQYRGDLAGVIGCGGGFSSQDLSAANPFVFYGTAGNADFNYLELMQLDQALDGSGIPHFIQEFEGKHEWAPPMAIRGAFYWFTFESLRKGQIQLDSSWVTQCETEYQQDLTTLKKSYSGDELAYRTWRRKTLQTILLRGLVELEDRVKEVTETLPRRTEIQRYLTRKGEWEELEISLSQQYGKEFVPRDVNWWAGECTKLSTKARSSASEADVYKRVLSYLSLFAYMYTTQTLSRGEWQQTEKFLSIYSCVDPENPEHRYLTALMKAKQNDKEATLTALTEAVELGFDEGTRMQQEGEFIRLLAGDPRFGELVQKAQQQE